MYENIPVHESYMVARSALGIDIRMRILYIYMVARSVLGINPYANQIPGRYGYMNVRNALEIFRGTRLGTPM